MHFTPTVFWLRKRTPQQPLVTTHFVILKDTEFTPVSFIQTGSAFTLGFETLLYSAKVSFTSVLWDTLDFPPLQFHLYFEWEFHYGGLTTL